MIDLEIRLSLHLLSCIAEACLCVMHSLNTSRACTVDGIGLFRFCLAGRVTLPGSSRQHSSYTNWAAQVGSISTCGGWLPFWCFKQGWQQSQVGGWWRKHLLGFFPAKHHMFLSSKKCQLQAWQLRRACMGMVWYYRQKRQ